MFESNTISVEKGLFAGKGQAKPTADYVPALGADSPAETDDPLESTLAITQPAAKPAPGATGLGGLIQRRVETRQATTEFVETEPQSESGLPNEIARAEREAAQRIERESAALTAKASDQAERGMLYETLRLGLPAPKPEATETKPNIPTLADAAPMIEPMIEPTGPAIDPAPAPTSAPTATAEVAPKQPRRRKMTMRLERDEWARLKAYADETDRTYQDILSTATNSYLDEILDDDAILDDDDVGQPAVAVRPADLPRPQSHAAKSPYDWFRTNRMR